MENRCTLIGRRILEEIFSLKSDSIRMWRNFKKRMQFSKLKPQKLAKKKSKNLSNKLARFQCGIMKNIF